MMTKKKKRYRRPPRRSTYETTLDHATVRLAKAVDERTAALMKIDSLNREIPYLENIVSALKPPEPDQGPAVLAQNRPSQPKTFPPTAAAAPVNEMDQEEFLQRFIPRGGRITSPVPPSETRPQSDGSSSDPDEFLNDVGGEEILS